MYRLTIFILISSAVPQQLVGAVRVRESPSGRNNLYFDSYDHESSEEDELRNDEESGTAFREAVLMQPEEVIDFPPIPLERDYDVLDPSNEGLRDDYTDESLRDTHVTRHFLQDLINQIQAAIGIWVPEIPTQPATKQFYYYLDDSLDAAHKKNVKAVLEVIGEKTCSDIKEGKDKIDVILMGSPSCLTEIIENKIIIGQECYDATITTKLIMKVLDLCKPVHPKLKTSGVYLNSFRKELQREAEQEFECVDKISFCNLWVRNGDCSSFYQILAPLCPRTCRVCGEYCRDYSSQCETNDTVKDCLSNWSQKRFSCADTCGICKRPMSSKCVDLIRECEWLAKKGFCSKYPDTMKEYCPVSCGYCKPELCVDERSDCSELERGGACKKIPGLMQENCKKTCNFCQNGRKSRGYEEKQHDGECIADTDFIRKFCSWDENLIVE